MNALLANLPTGRQGRVLAVGIAVVAAVLAWLALVAPLLDWYGERDTALADRTEYARRMTALAAGLPQAEQAAAAARDQAVPTQTLLSGTTDPIAGAALESLIDGMAHDAGATLVSTEALPGVQTGAFRRIGLRVTVRASWTNLMGLLAAIERAEPRMSIADMQIQAGPLTGVEQLLDMSFSALAFRAGTATAADATAAAPPSSDDAQ